MAGAASAEDGARRPRRSIFSRLGGSCARYHWLVLACWVVVLAGAGYLIPNFLGYLTGPSLKVYGSGSAREYSLVQSSFVHPFSEEDTIVFDSQSLTVHEHAYQQVIQNTVSALSRQPRVAGVLSPLAPLSHGQVSADGHAAIAIAGVSGSQRQLEAFVPQLTKVAESNSTKEVRIYVTGTSPLIHALAHQQSTDLVRAERFGLPIAALILILAFGTLVAAGVPLLLAIAGIALAWGVLGAVSFGITFDLFVENITTMIGLGVGIDYSLLIATRFREELKAGDQPINAAAAAISSAGKAVFCSGTAVILSLATLFLVDAQIFHDLAIGAVITVAVAMLAAVTLLPALLGLLGKRINRLAIPLLPSKVERLGSDQGFWAGWAHQVMRFSLPCAVLSVAVLLAIAYPLLGIKLGLDTGASSIGNLSAGKGLAVLGKDFTPGIAAPIQVTVESQGKPLTLQDFQAVARLSSAIQGDRDAVQVESLPTVLEGIIASKNPAAIAAAAAHPQVAETLLHYLLNYQHGGNVTIVGVIPRGSPTAGATQRLVRRIRSRFAPKAVQGTGLKVLVGGLPAQVVDISDETEGKLPIVVALIVVITFVFLATVFRSIFLPFKAVVMNILSIAAAFGALVFVFQEGHGATVFSFQTPHNIQLYLPLLTFAILFGLSMDYEIFLVGRMREEWERTKDNQQSVRRGLQYTARVIASAAAIEVAVFGSFVFSNTIEIKELGFSLAIAIFLDATVVRLLLVPSLMRLAGRWNWSFPHWLDRLLPVIKLGATDQSAESQSQD